MSDFLKELVNSHIFWQFCTVILIFLAFRKFLLSLIRTITNKTKLFLAHDFLSFLSCWHHALDLIEEVFEEI